MFFASLAFRLLEGTAVLYRSSNKEAYLAVVTPISLCGTSLSTMLTTVYPSKSESSTVPKAHFVSSQGKLVPQRDDTGGATEARDGFWSLAPFEASDQPRNLPSTQTWPDSVDQRITRHDNHEKKGGSVSKSFGRVHIHSFYTTSSGSDDAVVRGTISCSPLLVKDKE